MNPCVRSSGEYALAALAALAVSGLLCIGILSLTDFQQTQRFERVEGGVRLNLREPEPHEEQEERRRPEEIKPPEPLPKAFSARKTPQEVKPAMDLRLPNFSAEMHPSLANGLALPAGALGGIGFNMDEVDEIPQALRSVPPEYPYGAKRNLIEGKVVVRMLVTSEGIPTNLSVHSTEPAGIFDKAALAAARNWRFKPGRYSGKDVDTWVLLPFNFELTQ
ncbi:MAG: TonB family protein [Desulfocurvibacter africanus]